MWGSSTPAAAIRQARDLELAPVVGHVQPAALGERRPQVLPGQRPAVHPMARVGEVVRRVLQPRPEVVVAAEHEHPRHGRAGRRATAPPRAPPCGWARLSPVLTTRSGSQRASSRSHACLCRWFGRMWMSLMCSTRSGDEPGRQHRHRDLAHHERVALDDRGVADPGDGRAGGDRGGSLQDWQMRQAMLDSLLAAQDRHRARRDRRVVTAAVRRVAGRRQHRHRDRRQARDLDDRRARDAVAVAAPAMAAARPAAVAAAPAGCRC